MRELKIATANSAQAKTWKNKTITWEDFCHRLQTPIRTSETVDEYKKMKKPDRDAIKDKGGFVGGELRDNSRKADDVICRSMITHDIDSAGVRFIEEYCENSKYLSCLYTTHSHTPEQPRVRIITPLTRDVTPAEYVAISRLYAAEWGIDQFDECSFKPNQLMYWPTAPSDGEYVYKEIKGEVLDPDEFLSKYPNWQDCSMLPYSSKEKAVRESTKKKQEDPLAKTGIIGAFCRAYSIQDAISSFLSDVYKPSTVEGRYDYINGESYAGVVIYDDKFAYSHHATDPACGKLLNAFDLVRIHKFNAEEESLSFKAMCDFASNDEKVKTEINKEAIAKASEDFKTINDSWDDPLALDYESMPEFPIDALPPVLRNYVKAVAESTQTAIDMSAVGVLCAVSASMRNNYKVKGKNDWLEPTNIYGLIIAEPSERKSAVVSFITKPIDEYIKQYNDTHKVDFEMSKATKQRLENKKNSLISASKKKGEDVSGQDFNDELQKVIEELVNFDEKKPLRIYVDDTTPEKLVETLAENNNAISIISSEGGIFDVLSGTYSNKVNIDVFLKSYSGENIAVDRIMRESVSVDHACLTILLSVQPIVIGDLMKNEKFRHRGLTARFLYTHPKSLIGERNFDSDTIPPEVYEGYKALIFNVLAEKHGASANVITLDAGAKRILKDYYNWVEKRMVSEYSAYGDWIGKLAGNTLRIAGILARASVMKQSVSDELFILDDDIVITPKIMTDAIRIGKYFFSHAIKAYSTMGVYSEFQALLKAIAKIKEKDVHTICRRDLMHLCRWIASAEEAQSILEGLEDYGYIKLVAVDASDKIRGGRPKNPTYAVNPRVLK